MAEMMTLVFTQDIFFFASQAKTEDCLLVLYGNTVEYARTNVIGSRNFFVIASVRISVH